jgi:hypothetical protein
MKLIEYLGRQLKDGSVLELLEHQDMEVVYRFDRLHENSHDEYTAAARDAGFELRFDENQMLKTIFCYVQGRDGFSAIDQSIVGATIFESLAEAKAAAEKDVVGYKHNDGMDFLGRRLSWISFERANRKFHYEYSPSGLSLITLSNPDGKVV